MKSKLLAICSFLALPFAPLCLQASAQVITTVAGGYIGDGALATSAAFDRPMSVANDSAGNLYIADTRNHRIRKVAPDGSISTVAGNGNSGFNGDGGLAVHATLKFPNGIAMDTLGNLYIADSFNYRIRKVTPDGIISTVAGNGTEGYAGDGGPATGAQLDFPNGIAVGSSGTIYIADTSNNAIRRVTTNGVISTVAGNGIYGYSGDGGLAISAQLASPTGVAVDGDGALYIADRRNDRIRKVATDGIITTVMGTGVHGSNCAVDSSENALLSFPRGVTVNATGTLLVVDTGNHCVRVPQPDGWIFNFIGTGEHGYSGDGGFAMSATLSGPSSIAVDSSNRSYVADTGNHRIRKVDTNSIITTIAGIGRFSGDGQAATSATLYQPLGVVKDNNGNIYIADSANQRIRKVATNGNISTYAGNGNQGFAGDGGQAINAEFRYPSDLAVDSAGNLYISDTFNDRIRKIALDGTIATVAGGSVTGELGDGGSATNASLDRPIGIALDNNGNLYIADSYHARIRKVSTDGIITSVAGNGDSGYSGDGGPAIDAALNYPKDVSVDGSGAILIADAANNRVRKVGSDGIIATIVGNGTEGYSGDGGAATNAEITGPESIAVDTNGALYISDAYNGVVRGVTPEGVITTVAGNGNFGFSGDGGDPADAVLYEPSALAVDEDGDIYIADKSNNRIRRVNFDAIFINGFD